MRVLALSPGPVLAQLERLPALAAVAEALGAMVQVACDPKCRAAWELMPGFEKLIPFSFESNPSLADWTNLLGCVREPDFQACLNFASGWNLDLLLSLSHIPLRIARGGFSCTNAVDNSAPASDFLKPLGLQNDQESFRISLPQKALEQARAKQPAGDGPLLLLAPSQAPQDWADAHWRALEEAVSSRISGGRCQRLKASNVMQQAAQLASADGVVSSSSLASGLAKSCGVSVVELQELSAGKPLTELPLDTVLQALGIT